MIAADATVESAIACLKLGASDYLGKPVNVQRIESILARLASLRSLTAECDRRLEWQDADDISTLTGESLCMREVFEHITRVAPSTTSVCCSGSRVRGRTWQHRHCIGQIFGGIAHLWR